jgi:tetrahydromethanopterin S-methyltransferase subunit A
MNTSTNRGTPYQLVRMVHGMSILSDWLTAGPLRRSIRKATGHGTWPSVPGAYLVGDRTGSIAICTLSNNKLMAPLAALPGVAIVGRVYTANLGIEKIITNVTDNPAIRFLVLCGKESPFFQTGQALQSLLLRGVTTEGHIIGAKGHLPQLTHTQPTRIERFRQQVEVVDCTGETDVSKLTNVVQELAARNPGRFSDAGLRLNITGNEKAENEFKVLRPGGQREPLAYDPSGFFIITLDQQLGEIDVRHYLSDHTPAHVMRGRNAEAILLGLLREGLISQMSHAGYLGAELAKAEAAHRLGMEYEQDQPLRPVQPIQSKS